MGDAPSEAAEETSTAQPWQDADTRHMELGNEKPGSVSVTSSSLARAVTSANSRASPVSLFPLHKGSSLRFVRWKYPTAGVFTIDVAGTGPKAASVLIVRDLSLARNPFCGRLIPTALGISAMKTTPAATSCRSVRMMLEIA